MKFALDTSAYSANLQGNPGIGKWFSEQNHICIPIVVIAELRAGFANGNKRKQNEDLLEEFLSSPYTDILNITEKTTRYYAKIYVGLRRIGRPINTNDIWIASLCLEHNLPLLTLDADFKNIKTLKLL